MSHKVTTFKDIKSTSVPYYKDVTDVLEQIRNGEFKELVESIREEEDKTERNELKKNLQAICFSGEFTKRAANAIVKHSGLICLDFDDFESDLEMLEMKKALQEDTFTYSVFISPSGNGLKVLTRIPEDIENHKNYFNALEEYHSSPNFDKACKDISRVCYASYDPDIFINPEAETWIDKDSSKTIEVDKSSATGIVTIDDHTKVIMNLRAWWDKNHGFVEGQRNNNVFILAAAFNQHGVPKSTAAFALNEFVSQDFPRSEVDTILNSAYRNTDEFGTKVMEDREETQKIKRKLQQGATKKDLKEELVSSGTDKDKADKIIENIEKSATEHVQVFWKKDDKGNVKIEHHRFRDFLQDNGFYKFYPEGSDNFIFVRRVSNRVVNTSEQNIKDFVLNYIETKTGDMRVWSFFADKTRFFKEDFLSLLDEIEINFIEDKEGESYLFFSNVAVRVTNEDVSTIEYDHLPGWVWDDQVIDRDFDDCDGSLCEFKKFINNISGEDKQRIKSVESTIGFLLHSYKPADYCPAVILNDEVISDNPEGGTGKGIFATAIGHVRKSVSIDGKGFNFDKSFPYQTVQQDTQMIVFDDVRANFDFERLFSVITEGITLEKKNKDAIKIPFERSPKITITTNYAIKGSGNSFERRKWELEFKQFYTKEFTPRDEFGHNLFSGWNESEWCIFDNYMIGCLQYYLKHGLVQSTFKNLKIRRLIAETDMDFYEWMKDYTKTNQLTVDSKIHLQDIMNKFTSENPDFDRGRRRAIQNRTLKKWLSKWCDFKYKTQLVDGRDANGVWVMFPKPKQVEQKELDI